MSKEEKKVSIIVPVYNYEEYVSQCIHSLLNQTYKNIEIIIIDDGSTDNSPQICDELSKLDNRIKLKHKSNEGLGKAYQDGLEMATGDYISFVDSDDYIAADTYEFLVPVAEKENADIIEFGTNVVDAKGEIYSKVVLKEEVLEGNEKILDDYFFVKTLPHLSAKLINKRMFTDFKFLDHTVAIDELTTMQLLLKCNKLVKTDKVFYYAVRRKKSCSQSVISGKRLAELFLCYEDIIEYMQKAESKYTSHYIIRFLRLLMVMFYRVEKENYAAESDVRDIKEKIISYYKLYYKQVDWGYASKRYAKYELYAMKIFYRFPIIFNFIYGIRRGHTQLS